MGGQIRVKKASRARSEEARGPHRKLELQMEDECEEVQLDTKRKEEGDCFK